MALTERTLDLAELKELLDSGANLGECAKHFGVDRKVIESKVRRYGLALPSAAVLPSEGESLQGDLQLTWSQIDDYLATGLSLFETATAAGVDIDYLKEAYIERPDKEYDDILVHSAVLRSRRTYELIKRIESQALNGDLRAFHTLSKIKYQRNQEDSYKPVSQDRDV